MQCCCKKITDYLGGRRQGGRIFYLNNTFFSVYSAVSNGQFNKLLVDGPLTPPTSDDEDWPQDGDRKNVHFIILFMIRNVPTALCLFPMFLQKVFHKQPIKHFVL